MGLYVIHVCMSAQSQDIEDAQYQTLLRIRNGTLAGDDAELRHNAIEVLIDCSPYEESNMYSPRDYYHHAKHCILELVNGKNRYESWASRYLPMVDVGNDVIEYAGHEWLSDTDAMVRFEFVGSLRLDE